VAHPVDPLGLQTGKVGFEKSKGDLLQFVLADSRMDPYIPEGSKKPIEMVRQAVETTAEARCDLVDSVPPKKSPIERRDKSLTLLHDLSVQIDKKFPGHSLTFSTEVGDREGPLSFTPWGWRPTQSRSK
jgi:hypothetical protein